MKRTLLAVTALLLAGTSLAQTKTLTVYSGRAKTFVDPVVQQFERQTGIKVNVRYGTDAQLVAAIREEGSKSPADVFYDQLNKATSRSEVQDLLSRSIPTSHGIVPKAMVTADRCECGGFHAAWFKGHEQ